MFLKIKKFILFLLILGFSFFVYNAIQIYRFSNQYSEQKSDVAIVLGAGTNNGKISPVFRERVNHGIYLYKNKIVDKIIFTGGFGENQKQADSEIAKKYALEKGVPEAVILMETKSKYTYQNLEESKKIMDSLNYNSALIVTDPLHSKRAMLLTEKYHINCKSSPTKTSMYKSFSTKMNSLVYETFYYSIRVVTAYF
ncbi:YdcF family protein [Aureivirga sp. CE67]|uniref:YdcF family protein n=1 Tax=Aureivirga sp. CE67 TaxID=1788983 RepID=UPI0018CB92CC|nr:YdcF family protein [Aureivirga sp. CE67]